MAFPSFLSHAFTLTEEFIADAEKNLGRANGSIKQRSPGVEGRHDGQVMVRLKSKRFVVLDYSFIPSAEELAYAKNQPHVNLPYRAGSAPCANKTCEKVGTPACLYDSAPTEPEPLYLRSGRCFQCQRNLNEQRRADRKRKPEPTDADFIVCVGPNPKRLKLGKRQMTLNEDAVVLNGPPPPATILQGCLSSTENSSKSLDTIATELTTAVHQAITNTFELTTNTNSDDDTVNANYRKTFQSLTTALCLMAQWKSVHGAASTTVASIPGPAMADAVAAAHAIVAKSEDPLLLSESAAVEETAGPGALP